MSDKLFGILNLFGGCLQLIPPTHTTPFLITPINVLFLMIFGERGLENYEIIKNIIAVLFIIYGTILLINKK